MLIESKIKIGHDSMFNICQANFKSANLLNRMAPVQFQCRRTVSKLELWSLINPKIITNYGVSYWLRYEARFEPHFQISPLKNLVSKNTKN